ncbi:hypothetical protein HZH68_014665 [Vespula germanica]|uniref:Uncharacterized protein n=1 Tax=Vespula germanica TaxID=30212 RepID=A0A834J8I3_VESGE|nr:hypothetical protein HZH68_014665 [Vespula germanica]
MDGNVFNRYEKCRDQEYYYSDEAKSDKINPVQGMQKLIKVYQVKSDTAYPQPYDIWDEDPLYAKNQLSKSSAKLVEKGTKKSLGTKLDEYERWLSTGTCFFARNCTTTAAM